MRVAVTGASGFVGRHVMTEFEKVGVPAAAVTRLCSRHDTSTAVGDIAIDIHAPPPDAFTRMNRPQLLLHLAWSNLDDYRSPQHLERALPAHTSFLKGMIDAGVQHIVVAGTCLEYGMHSGPLDETMEAKPIVPYAAAKNNLRLELERIRERQAFRLTWVRLFYVFGNGQSKRSLFSQMKDAVARKDSAFDLSRGDQLRDYLPIAEAARLLVAIALVDKDAGIVNVCSGKPVSVRQIAEGWVKEFNWPIKLRPGIHPYVDYEPMEFWGVRAKLDHFLCGV